MRLPMASTHSSPHTTLPACIITDGMPVPTTSQPISFGFTYTFDQSPPVHAAGTFLSFSNEVLVFSWKWLPPSGPFHLFASSFPIFFMDVSHAAAEGVTTSMGFPHPSGSLVDDDTLWLPIGCLLPLLHPVSSRSLLRILWLPRWWKLKTLFLGGPSLRHFLLHNNSRAFHGTTRTFCIYLGPSQGFSTQIIHIQFGFSWINYFAPRYLYNIFWSSD